MEMTSPARPSQGPFLPVAAAVGQAPDPKIPSTLPRGREKPTDVKELEQNHSSFLDNVFRELQERDRYESEKMKNLLGILEMNSDAHAVEVPRDETETPSPVFSTEPMVVGSEVEIESSSLPFSSCLDMPVLDDGGSEAVQCKSTSFILTK